MKLEEKLERRINEDNRSEAEETTTVITAVVDYFTEINSLKSLLKGLEPDISRLLEEPTRVLVASRKGPAIRSNVVKNKLLCAHTPLRTEKPNDATDGTANLVLRCRMSRSYWW